MGQLTAAATPPPSLRMPPPPPLTPPPPPCRFVFLSTRPDPTQIDCGTPPSPARCPVWDGEAIYIAPSGPGAVAVTLATDVNTTSPGVVAISEFCRLARQGPSGPKRCVISCGGWSDFARIGDAANAKKLAALLARLVQLTFADGVDFDFEHLTPFDALAPTPGAEFAAFATAVAEVRRLLDGPVAAQWRVAAGARRAALAAAYAKLEPWQRQASPFYPTNDRYLGEVASNPPPTFTVSYTTRFNAFVDASAPWNFLARGSVVPARRFETDGEGSRVWGGGVGAAVDSVNIMAFDAGSSAGALTLNMTQVWMRS